MSLTAWHAETKGGSEKGSSKKLAQMPLNRPLLLKYQTFAVEQNPEQ